MVGGHRSSRQQGSPVIGAVSALAQPPEVPGQLFKGKLVARRGITARGQSRPVRPAGDPAGALRDANSRQKAGRRGLITLPQISHELR
jgi:hypothetical protein